MVIDRTHTKWAVSSVLVLAFCVILYTTFGSGFSQPFGGTILGLIFGGLGYLFMLVAALLGARQKVPAWRVGRLQTWMRAHLWLGLLSFPVILLHSRFSFGFGLTKVLMTLFTLVIVSGIFGALLQHYLPSKMTRDVTLETTYEQIGRISDQLVAEGEALINAVTSPVATSSAKSGSGSGNMAGTKPALPVPAGAISVENAVIDNIRHYWNHDILPFLKSDRLRARKATFEEAHQAISRMHVFVPAPKHGVLLELQELCVERAQLNRQLYLHHWLYGWLLLHVPLSYALLLLIVVHAVSSLRY